jgi:hypothetical protein
MLLGASNFPLSDVPNPGRYTVTPLPDDAANGPVTVNGASIASVDGFVSGLHTKDAYLVLSHSMVVYARYYESPTGLPTLMREIQTAPDWKLYYRNQDVRVYRFRPPAQVAPPAHKSVRTAARKPATRRRRR